MSRSLLDPAQVIQSAFDEADGSFRTISFGGALVPEHYDEIALTYVPSGNGVGEIQTVTYKLAGNQIALLTLSYNGSNKLIDVLRS